MTTEQPFVTPAQVWYVARVYPETVTDAEAREPYGQAITSEADRSYWEATADVLNRLADKRLSQVVKERDDAIDAEKIALREIGAENEQLRETVKQWQTSTARQIEVTAPLRAEVKNQRTEIERLRADIKTWGQIWNDPVLLAARTDALRDGTADLGQLDADARQPAPSQS